ncbi:hypothetical protein G6F43_003063 [Rhizopus delemar]|nr:hypothetical protein G6F43_003063 [Rhizopus delemar]
MKVNVFFLFISFILYVLAQDRPIFGSHKLVAYIVDWDLPRTIYWDKLDHVSYAFAVPNKEGDLNGFNKTQLNQVVKEAHHHGKGVSLAIGGWTGSIYFSSLVRTEASRKSFATKLINAVEEYDLNGLNIDWEYPNDPRGIFCNRRNPQDTSNFLALIQLLRETLDKKYPKEHKIITAAVSTYTFKDDKQNSIKTLDDGWSKYMDAFYIMAYDLNGIFSQNSSANAPLEISNMTNPTTSGAAAVQSWISAGIPSNKIYLGVPFYGYTHKTTAEINLETGIHVPFDRKIPQIKGDSYDDFAADPCPGANRSFSGEIQWRTIEQRGIDRNASGWATFWDSTSQTPFAYKQDNQQFVTFDNPTSLRIKSNYVNENRLGGVMLWSLEMDDTDHSLLEALQDVRMFIS